jgi:hypothetical protein
MDICMLLGWIVNAGPFDAHSLLNQSSVLLLQYGEFRRGFAKDKIDTRIVHYGLRYFIEQYVSRRWTLEDVEQADTFFR